MYRSVKLSGNIKLLQLFYLVQMVKHLLIVLERSQVEHIPGS
jgi:hypothetical protein